METINKQTIILDLRQTSTVPIPSFIQHDTNILEIIIKDNGADADLSSIDNVTVNYKRPDGQTLTTRIQAKGNVLTYQFGNEEMTVGGYGELNLQLFTNNTRLSTKRLKVYFAKSLGAAFENSAGLPLLQELFVEVEEVTKATTEAGHYALDKGNIAEEKAAEAEAAAANANQETANLSGLKSTLSAATQSADDATKEAITQAEYAKTQAEFSKEQAAYAKKEADRLVGTDVSVLDNNIKKVVSELADKATQNDLTNSINQISQLTANKLDKTTTDISISQINKNRGLIDETYLSDNLKAQIAGTAGIHATPAPKSVTLDKLAFTPILGKISKNLFNKETVTSGRFFNTTLNDSPTYSVSDYIPVLPNTNYYKTSAWITAEFDSNLNFIKMTGETRAITTSATTAFVRLNVKLTELPTFQFELGTVATTYETHKISFSGGDILDNTVTNEKLYNGSITNEKIANSTIEHAKLVENYAIKRAGKNLFNKSTVTIGYYLNNGVLTSSTSGLSVSDFIAVNPSTTYYKNNTVAAALFDSNKKYIGNSGATNLLATTGNTAYVKLNFYQTTLNTLQLELGSAGTAYESFGTFIQPSEVKGLNEIIDKTGEPTFAIQLPDVIYAVTNEEINLYHRNYIKFGDLIDGSKYYVRIQKKNGTGVLGVGTDVGYKWFYTPVTPETIVLIIRVYDTKNQAILAAKEVTLKVVSKLQTSPKTARIVTIGSSSSDLYGITSYLHDFVNSGTNTNFNMIGCNKTEREGVYDDTQSGQGYPWYYSSQKVHTLRNDRALSDAIWDTGWGENETYGWKTGQTYSNLTEEQRSHGKTKNQFFNPATSVFDFTYYMSTYHPNIVPHSQTGQHLDGFLSLNGLNDVAWLDVTSLKNSLPNLMSQIIHIINSVHAWDSSVKVGLYLLPPTAKQDSFFNSYSHPTYPFLHSARAKYVQELFNEKMLEVFGTSEMQAKGVQLIAANAHFDTRYGLRSEILNPVKFDTTIKETVVMDIHPNDIGAKYTADIVRNFVVGELLHDV